MGLHVRRYVYGMCRPKRGVGEGICSHVHMTLCIRMYMHTRICVSIYICIYMYIYMYLVHMYIPIQTCDLV